MLISESNFVIFSFLNIKRKQNFNDYLLVVDWGSEMVGTNKKTGSDLIFIGSVQDGQDWKVMTLDMGTSTSL